MSNLPVFTNEQNIVYTSPVRCPKCGGYHGRYIPETGKYMAPDSSLCPIKDVELSPCDRCGEYHIGSCA